MVYRLARKMVDKSILSFVKWIVLAGVVLFLLKAKGIHSFLKQTHGTIKYFQRSVSGIATLDTISNKNMEETVKELVKNVRMAQGTTNSNDKYVSVRDIVRGADHDDKKTRTITWCSICDENQLHYVDKLATFWNGPTSIAVFTHGSKIPFTLKYISALHHCVEDVKRKVNFHLCIPVTDVGSYLDNTISEVDYNGISCSILGGKEEDAMQSFGDNREVFPVNILRNLAMKTTDTPYVLNIDIDFVPSKHFYETFSNFIADSKNVVKPKAAIVVPSFESNIDFKFPISKKELTEKWNEGDVRPFFEKGCRVCHANTNYQKWKTTIFAYHVDFAPLWEPFLIARRNEVPDFDERFMDLRCNRVSQVCEIHMLGFDFSVADNLFVIHDGLKDNVINATSPHQAMELVLKNKQFNELKVELQKRYSGTGRAC